MEQVVLSKESTEEVVSRVSEQVRILVELDRKQKIAEGGIRQAAWDVSRFIASIIPKSISIPFGVEYRSYCLMNDSVLDLSSPRHLVELVTIGDAVHFRDLDSVDCAAAQRLGFALRCGLMEKIAEILKAETPKYDDSKEILKAALPSK